MKHVAWLASMWLGCAAAMAAPVPTVTVGSSPAGAGFELDGTVEALRQATVAAQVAGNVTQLAVKAGDKAKELGQAGQEKIDTMKTEKKVKDLKEELGGIVYAQHAGNAEDNAQAEIDRILGEIDEAEASLAEAAAADASGEGGDAAEASDSDAG